MAVAFVDMSRERFLALSADIEALEDQVCQLDFKMRGLRLELADRNRELDLVEEERDAAFLQLDRLDLELAKAEGFDV